MKLNQVTIGVSNVDEAIRFYEKLGLRLIVHTHDAYARFETPSGETFSVHLDDAPGSGSTLIYFEYDDLDDAVRDLQDKGIAFDSTPEDKSWLWREARLTDPFGNRLCLYTAGENRRFPPWRRGAQA